ncbi:MAG: AMP-binding protein [Thaumarchaeota archaeon]|nr:AMP-binding protein [Nitrososphaerota archaeon]
MAALREVPDWLRWRAGVSPDAVALKFGAVELSYRDLQERASGLSAFLLSRGVGRGDRVALLASPSESTVALVHAIARVGAVSVPLNHRQSTPELLSQLRDSRPSLVIHDAALCERAKELQARWELVSDSAAESAAVGLEPVPGDRLDASSPHAIVYTSGSSGAPKGVELSLSNLMWNAVSVGFRLGASSEDKWLLCMPLFHVGGYTILFRSVMHGSGVVLHPRFDPKRVSLSLDNDGVTMASFVPTMLSAVLEARGGKPLNPKVRLILLGGGQPPASLVAAIKERQLPVLLTYGMTETCSLVALSNAWSSSDGPAYRAVFPSEVTVAKSGTKGRLVPADIGEEGEVAVRGPTLFGGYWRKPALTRARFRGDWFLTGDVGVLQPGSGPRGGPTGGIAILGRKEETIVTGGEKVFPAEVEAALREHPAVKDAVVVGVDDARWGQRVVAALEAKPEFLGSPPAAAELTAFLRDRVGRYKIPKQYHFWAALPRSATGKARRGDVRALLERGGGDS